MPLAQAFDVGVAVVDRIISVTWPTTVYHDDVKVGTADENLCIARPAVVLGRRRNAVVGTSVPSTAHERRRSSGTCVEAARAATPVTMSVTCACAREATAVAARAGVTGGVERASTRTTALSQHCLCGARVPKSLAERTHACGACDLRGDRDAVSATLAACVAMTVRGEPASAALDLALAHAVLDAPTTRARLFATLPYALNGRQDVRSESTVHSARDGWSAAEKGPSPDLVVVGSANRWHGVVPNPG